MTPLLAPVPPELRPWVAQATAVRLEAPPGETRVNRFPALAGGMLTYVVEGRLRMLGPDAASAALPRATLSGPASGPLLSCFEGRLHCVGVLLHPWALAALLHGEASPRLLTDRHLPAEALLGPDWLACERALQEARDDRARLAQLFAFLRRRLLGEPRVVDLTRRLQGLRRTLAGHAPLPEAARAAGLGERQFERVFTQQFGLAPRLFQRITRLEGALLDALLHRQGGAELALRHGYYDQAHLARDCRLLAGATPGRLALAAETDAEFWPLEIGAGHARGAAAGLVNGA
ncbi:AraC family transcriptional regulator [Roseateles sp. DAIF2]|uniref:helix-turn-helix domain-containing protein n=1 Tax=Roseateles sp. DAIF2 TaxID=2714952 RepID=UPI0018A33344|nr:helix-turn-helix domain-containing protein [Roseateles sp. DAIF2]QPF71962.1 AraC family transcriptional regulator [Roseateles sp. DAIF2]